MKNSFIDKSNQAEKGTLLFHIISAINSHPIENAEIKIFSTGNPNLLLKKLKTDSSGQTEPVFLETPPKDYSLDYDCENQPYSEYTFEVFAKGYESVSISGAELFSGITAIQEITLKPIGSTDTDFQIHGIPGHTLYEEYPKKYPESEIKPTNESGEIVLSRVVIPEFIVVHDGSPRDPSAENYYIPYKDYIKNVASSEIYATWPDATIRANILAIMSFTLNRVYTEWYRNQGHDFTITSSTAFDQKWIPNRNIYDSISIIVDEIFACYLSRPNIRQPILTQYCDGRYVHCDGWMTQWGSKELGDQGYSAIEILRYYYGDDLYINTAQEISGIPASWPGYDLTIGSSGDKVRQLQEELNIISGAYPALPKIIVDGVYGKATANDVREFQKIFHLPKTGVVDYRTWYKISQIYVGVSRIAELR